MRRPKIRTDFIINGEGHGSVADRLLDADMNPAVLRPWKSRKNGRSYVTVNGKNYVTNASATLTKESWLELDSAVIEVARPRLRVWGDLVDSGLIYNIPDGMGTIVLQEQTTGEAGSATISMDGLRQSDNDRPTYDLRNYPIPIIHGEFQFSARQIAVSRKGNMPLDTTMARFVTRRIVEQVELMAIGAAPSYSYGGGTLYGLINKPERLTKVLTPPTNVGWTPSVLIDEVLEMISDLQDNQYYGNYGMYYSPGWTPYMGGDYESTYGGETLMTRLAKIEELQFIRKLQFGLSGFQIIIFQLTDDVVRALNGMDLTTLQWDAHGGLAKHFKIMCIYLTQVRNDAEERSGINHGVAA